jgi:hypothetical protein
VIRYVHEPPTGRRKRTVYVPRLAAGRAVDETVAPPEAKRIRATAP